MSDVATETIETEESPAFLQAVSDLAQTRTVVTSQPIFNTQGIKLLEGGARIDRGLYDRLVSHRLTRPLDECVDAEPPLGTAVLRESALAALERWPFFARMAPTGTIRNVVLEALAGVPLPKPVALHLALARDTRPSLFEHSILMALLSAYLAHQGTASSRETRDAAAAGLLHDMGMLHIAPDLLDADERLSADRLKPVYVHPLTSSILIGRFADYPKTVVRAIVEHHERLDGSGYPRGLVGESISPLGRIVSLAEVVTAMFDGSRALPEKRVSLLLRIDPRRYDPALVAAVHRVLRDAPPPDAGLCGPAARSIERLLRLADELARWRETSQPLLGQLDGPHAALLRSINEQNATLQRMLHEAGVTPEQLGALGDGLDDDGPVRVELWALAEELLWQLHATANQLKRRWHSAEPALHMPAALATWLAGVEALDAVAGVGTD